MHETLAEFVQAEPHGSLSDGAEERLLARAQEKFAPFLTDPDFFAFRWPRLVEGLRQMLRFERRQRATAQEIYVEEKGEWRLSLFDGSSFHLTAVADRIEIDAKGAAFLFDYKTGDPPERQAGACGLRAAADLGGCDARSRRLQPRRPA